MKSRLIVSVLITLALLTACKKKSQTEPEETYSILGEWSIIEFKQSMNNETTTLTESQLNESGMVWDLEFDEGQTFEQSSNMAGDGTLLTDTGTFATAGNQLTLVFETSLGLTITYDYSVARTQLNLTRSFPSPYGTVTVNPKFRRQ
ncbi:hypothetical protein HQ585_01570 [candidate division KSB1 bacterium]|nr:hypothetical protein [candidate division KSB1 bacterium]